MKEDGEVCGLCQKHHSQVSIPAHWKSEEARSVVLSLQVSLNTFVCRLCRQDVNKVLSDKSYVPRWRKGSKLSACCVMDCTGDVFATLHKASSDQIQAAFEAGELRSSESQIPVPTPLCKHHYHQVYNYIQPTQTHSVTCGTSLKHSNSRVCSKPALIEQYLKENTEFDCQISDQDRVCYACYRSHLITLQQSDNFSSDEDLKQLITTLSEQVQKPCEVKSIQKAIDIAMKRVAIIVGKELLDGNVLLLPSVHDVFCVCASEIIRANNLKGDPTKFVTSRWILSNLKVSLQGHIAYNCKIRKYGTLIYRPHSDLLPALAQALWKLRNARADNLADKSDITCETSNVSPDSTAFDDLNSRIHSQIRTLLTNDTTSPFEYDSVDIDKLIADTDEKLWEAICLLTRSVSERRGKSKACDPTSAIYHTKKVRRFFLLCMLLFCTDDRCSLPLHTLVTDIVDSQGGSALLVKILNRLGVCSSIDTLYRFIQHKVDSLDIKQNQYMDPESFTIISADNIDFLHSYARVFRGNRS